MSELPNSQAAQPRHQVLLRIFLNELKAKAEEILAMEQAGLHFQRQTHRKPPAASQTTTMIQIRLQESIRRHVT